MHFNQIDEIIKRGLELGESKSEEFAAAAKSRVWEAIEKPKKKSKFYLGFVMAMAAAISLFLVSTFLFLKLQSKERELAALQTNVKEQTAPEALAKEDFQPSENLKIVPNRMEDQEPIAVQKKEENFPVVKLHNLPQPIQEQVQEIETTFPPFAETEVIVPYPEILHPEIIGLDLKAEIPKSSEWKEETQQIPNTKTQKKLRLRFGSNSQTFNSGKSLALNIKF